MANPFDDPRVYDFIVWGGIPSPGIATISGGSRKKEWTENRGLGQQGATLVYSGAPLAEFTIDLKFDNSDDLEAYYREFQPLISTPKGQKPKAYDVWHPYLAAMKPPIKSAVVLEEGQVTEVEPGIFGVTIKCKEYAKVKVALITAPENSVTGKVEPEQPSFFSLANAARGAANDAVRAEIQRIREGG